MAIKIDGLSSAIAQELQNYTKEVVEKINEAGAQISKDGVKKLKETSPKNTGAYAKGWTVKKEEQYGKPTSYIIHNKKHYRLTHLLEKGWTMRNGKRHGPVKEHIGPVEEEVVNEYTKAVEGAIADASK